MRDLVTRSQQGSNNSFRNRALSNTEAEYVALVVEGSRRALDGPDEKAKLVVYGYNSSSLAIAQKEGVGKLKRLSRQLMPSATPS